MYLFTGLNDAILGNELLETLRSVFLDPRQRDELFVWLSIKSPLEIIIHFFEIYKTLEKMYS